MSSNIDITTLNEPLKKVELTHWARLPRHFAPSFIEIEVSAFLTPFTSRHIFRNA